MSGDGKRQFHIHARRITFHRRVEKFFNFRKFHDFIELRLNLPFLHSENCTVEKNIFSTSEFRMEAGADFQQTRDPTAHSDFAAGWLGDLAENFEQRGLSRTVASDD